MLDQYDPDRDPLTDSDIWSGYHGNSTQQSRPFCCIEASILHPNGHTWWTITPHTLTHFNTFISSGRRCDSAKTAVFFSHHCLQSHWQQCEIGNWISELGATWIIASVGKHVLPNAYIQFALEMSEYYLNVTTKQNTLMETKKEPFHEWENDGNSLCFLPVGF